MIEIIWLVIIVAVIAMISEKVMPNKGQKKTRDSGYDEVKIFYTTKPLMMDSEKSFFKKLLPLSQYGVNILPQVPLSSVVKKNGDYKWQSELYRTIDFGIFDNEYNLLLLVELNDASHQKRERYLRDKRVRQICADVGIKLRTFYTDKPNKQDYILHTIANDIREVKAGM